MKWCPNKKCGRIIEKLKDNDVFLFTCHCGIRHNFDLMGHEEDIEWIKNNTKKCPSCHANIEKIDGCNQM